MTKSEKYFESKGLKIDKNRVLTYSHLSCPFSCSYCFVGDMNFNHQKNVEYLNAEQIHTIGELPENIELLMLGCDTEFFQHCAKPIETLKKLVPFKKDISIVTKSILSNETIDQLADIDQMLKKYNARLFVSVSITCIDSYKKWEPKTPKPLSRIDNLIKLSEKGLKVFVAIRPLLPEIKTIELEKIVRLTYRYVLGYYSGPLYLKTLHNSLLSDKILDKCTTQKIMPHWMPPENSFYRIEKKGQMEKLSKIIKKYGQNLYEGAADAILITKLDEKH